MRAPLPAVGTGFDDAGLAASGRRAKAIWMAESAAERDRLLALAPLPRLAVLEDDDVRALLTAEHRAEVRASLTPAPGDHHHEREQAMATWTEERRRLVALHTMRPFTVAGCFLAALAPFV